MRKDSVLTIQMKLENMVRSRKFKKNKPWRRFLYAQLEGDADKYIRKESPQTLCLFARPRGLI